MEESNIRLVIVSPDSGDRIRGDRNRSFRGKREEKVFTREEGDFQKVNIE